MTDQIPQRPRFGELATPEEQRQRMGLPAEAPAEPADPALVPQDAPPGATPRGAASGPTPTGVVVDRIVTIAMLAYGIVNTITAIPILTDPAAFFGVIGIDVVPSDYASHRTAGAVAVGILVVGWMLTTWLAWRRGAKRRSMWWIALLGGVVFTFLSSLVLVVSFLQDPALVDAIMQMQGAVAP
ncbi:DUF6264 family protein [Microbacterium sp. gxy059]|uniref:DUF6264 family protein n=1 Tax=Microbacterium sp. gxy059 TaxID=2957199 RepID=UPI003D96DD06